MKIGLVVRGGNTKCSDTGCLSTVYRYGSKCTGIPEPTQGAELSLSVCLSLSLSLTRTHMHACAHTHTCAHARTHTLCTHFPPLPHPPPPPPSDVSFSLLLPTRHLVFLPSLSLCLSLLPICPWQHNKEPSKPGVEVKLLTVAIDIRREREQITAILCTPIYPALDEDIHIKNLGSKSQRLDEDIHIKNLGSKSLRLDEDIHIKNLGSKSLWLDEDIHIKNLGSKSLRLGKDDNCTHRD